jgi:hypothetical protein
LQTEGFSSDEAFSLSQTKLKEAPVGILSSIDPITLIVGIAIVPLSRLIGLVIALRGAEPYQRPAIIRALAELFRVMPPTRQRRPNYQQRSKATSTNQQE